MDDQKNKNGFALGVCKLLKLRGGCFSYSPTNRNLQALLLLLPLLQGVAPLQQELLVMTL